MEKNTMINEIIFYSTPQGDKKIDVYFQDENFWLTQKRMAELFSCSADNISLHLKNIFKDGELQENSVTEDFSVTADDDKRYKTPPIIWMQSSRSVIELIH